MKDRAIETEIERINSLKTDIERERKLKQKEKDLIFKNECQADIDFKRMEKIKCLEEEKEHDRLCKVDDEKYRNDVENERITMIREMAPHLYPGCIPRGMLREEEIQYLDDPLKNFLINKKSYPDTDLY